VLTVTEEGAEANDDLRFSALLWSLVSPRDLTKSPDRFTDKGQSRMGNTGEQGVAHGVSFSSPYESLQSREEEDHAAIS
jgi:hypothetical protein